jgi:hypothetical protein
MPHYTGTVFLDSSSNRGLQRPLQRVGFLAKGSICHCRPQRLLPLTSQPARWPRSPITQSAALSHQPAFPPFRAGSHRAAEWGRERWKSGRVVATIREIGRFRRRRAPILWGFFSRLRAGKAVATCDGRHRLQPAFEIPCARANIFGGQTAHAEGSWSANSPQARWQQWRGLS